MQKLLILSARQAGVPTVEVGLRVFGFGGQLLELRMQQPEFVGELLVVGLVHVRVVHEAARSRRPHAHAEAVSGRDQRCDP